MRRTELGCVGLVVCASYGVACGQICGDGSCETGEDAASCSADCLLVGGLVFDNLGNVLFSGIDGVTVHLEGINGNPDSFQVVSGVPISGIFEAYVSPGRYRISFFQPNTCFFRTASEGMDYVQGPPTPFVINVTPETLGQIGNIFIYAATSAEACAAQPCTDVDECDDNNDCTFDLCQSGACAYIVDETCCVLNIQCVDADACTVDTCQNGVCHHDPSGDPTCCNSAADCIDGSVCTADECVGNTCVNDAIEGCCAQDSECDDANVCTDDVCMDNVCVFTNNGVLCDDGNPCAIDDVCSDGVCAGIPLQCDDGNVCTDNDCVAGECIAVNNQASCDDGQACTENDVCTAGACSGVRMACDDGDACTLDSCADGVCGHVQVECSDDGLFCNGTEMCDPADGQCVSTDDACMAGQLCCEETDSCVSECCTVADCDDGLSCTEDGCTGGVCVYVDALFDLNGDGLANVVNDVPVLVNCIFGDLSQVEQCCPAGDCLCRVDCNGDGFLSVVGDVQCWVDCLFFGLCERPE